MTVAELENVAELRRQGNPTEALAKLDRVSESKQDAPYHYERGRVFEDLGRYEEAMACYEKALEQQSSLRAARFRLGYLCDLRGDEDRAMECYRACLELMPNDTPALLNLGTLYEERGYVDSENYDRAIECYKKVLETKPNHARARLALRDAQAATDMFYDEEQERRRDRRNQVLEIPVTDFELSVRSRNCLKKMNIRTLGDLIMHTDKDLLGYKNFGETSLMEIKEMLTSKGLTLGSGLEQQGARTPTPVPQPVPEPEPPASANAEIPLDSVEFSVRCRRAFQHLGVTTLGELAEKSEPELLGTKNFGQTSLNEVKQKLRRYGLALRE